MAAVAEDAISSATVEKYRTLRVSRITGLSLINFHRPDSPAIFSNAPAKGRGKPQLRSYKLRRFPLRGIAVIIGPLLVLACYALIWRLVQLRRDTADKLKYGLPNENWIHYAWFVVGVFGLNFSKYGLLGLEASMLHDRRWQAKNTMALLMHCENFWSGPGGWLKCGKLLLWRRTNPVGRLWYTLAVLSCLPFIALPLSGLTVELVDGYVKLDNNTSAPPLMGIGHTWKNFNRRPEGGTGGDSFWKTGFPPTVPGIGIAYTAPQVQRDSIPYLHSVPNVLPSNISESNPDLFLVPQSDVPVSGKTWGLLIGCNCSIVRSFSEFTILNRRPSFKIKPHKDSELYDDDYGGEAIRFFDNPEEGGTSNMFAHAELGFQPPGIYGLNAFYLRSSDFRRPSVLEYALWQGFIGQDYNLAEKLPFNKSIDFPMADAPSPYLQGENGFFYFNEKFYEVKNDSDVSEGGGSKTALMPTPSPGSHSPQHMAAPIGVRCIRHSMLGQAEVDWHGTFRSFNETPFPEDSSNHESGEQFAFGSISDSIAGKFSELLTSTNSPAVLRFALGTYFPSYIQAETLYRSIMLAHAWDALRLMYDNSYTFESAHPYENVTGSRPSKIIGPGSVLPIYPGILLILWAFGCVVLGLVYGFRRRWSETLDGYSMFRFGADFADEIRSEPDFVSTRGFEDCQALRRFPGLIGDSWPEMDVGHISLVRRRNWASKEKRYH
ncbi:hypothetical protein FQN51_006360 [Onygenales sp. PD_10]|nr:hypothetical protein FQN51_006360 [Onygenales sp. PD_10]